MSGSYHVSDVLSRGNGGGWGKLDHTSGASAEERVWVHEVITGLEREVVLAS